MGLSHVQDISTEFKEKIIWWIFKLNNIKLRVWKDKWISFTICWIVFDAYLTEISKLDRDSERLTYFLKNDNSFKKAILKDPNFLGGYGKRFKKLSPIYDMRPGHLNESREIKDEYSLEQIIRFVYQIRCNLFHGGKDIKNKRDIELVSLGESFLRGSIDKWRIV